MRFRPVKIHSSDPILAVMSPRLVLLCGLPGSGKTVVSRRLAGEIPAVRLCPDEWLARLGIDLFDEQTRERLEAQFWDLARQLLAFGQSVILESGFWLRSDRDEKRAGARALGAAVELRFLDVPIDELCRPLDARATSGKASDVPAGGQHLEHYATLFQAPDDAEQRLFDEPVHA